VSDFLDHARSSGAVVTEVDGVDTIFGTGRMGVLQSPAGLRVEVFERPLRLNAA
jgi:hypothetical protein